MSGRLPRYRVLSVVGAWALVTAVGVVVSPSATAATCPTADASGISGTDVDWSGCVIDGGGLPVSIAGASTISGATVQNASLLALGSVTAVGTVFNNDAAITQTGAGDFQNAVFGSATGSITLTDAGNTMPGAKFTGTYAGTISLTVMWASGVDFSGATFAATSKLVLRGDFSGSNLSGVDLSGTGRGSVNGSLAGATLTGAKLDGLDFSSLTSSCGITGAPTSLPAGWYFVGGCLTTTPPPPPCPTAGASGISGTDVDWSGCVIDGGGLPVSIAGTSTISGATVQNASPLALGSVTAVGTAFNNDANITQTGAGDFQNAVFGSATGSITLTDAGNTMPGAKFTGTYAGTISLTAMSASGVDFSGATFGVTSKLVLSGDFSGSNLSGVDLSGAGRGSVNGSLAGATLTGAKLDGLDFSSLTSSCGITGAPTSLPAGWYFVGGCLTTTPPPPPDPVYTISPFGAPVDPAPVVNTAKAGQAVPFKFTVTDGTGQPVTTLTSAATSAVAYACGTGSQTDSLETYATGSSGLQNLGGGAYQYTFKTDKTWAGSCRTLGIAINHASPRTALFQFTR